MRITIGRERWGTSRSRVVGLVLAAGVVIGLGKVGAAAPYTETLDLYVYSVGGEVDWVHTYDHSADPVTAAYLTIVADDVDSDEDDAVYFTDAGGSEHFLGYLTQMGFYTNWEYSPGPGNSTYPNAITTTVFSIDQSWLDTTPVRVRIASNWGAEIETSTLTVIPEPATLSLLALGGLAVIRRRRR